MSLPKKLLLFAVIIFFPFSIFYFFSLGEHHFERLPYLGPETNGKHFQYAERRLITVNGIDITDSLKGKTLIITSLDADYPNGAAFYIGAFKQIVVQEIQKNKKYKNVVVVSEIHEDDSLKMKTLYDRYHIPGKWYVCRKPDKSFYDVDNGEGNLMEIKDPVFEDLMIYERLVLLIDKNGYWRGCHDLTEGIKSKTFLDELRLLMKEYHNDYGAY